MRFSILLVLTSFLLPCTQIYADESKPQKALPFVENFDAARYLGKWHEIARLPTPVQPDNSLAIAEYSKGDVEGTVVVKNTAYDAKGEKLSTIEGKAQIAEGTPAGRLKVSFGPIDAKEPNYHVMHVDNDYKFAVVGNPDRKSLWILAREAPIAEDKLNSLTKIAEMAGFDTTKLIVAPWKKAQRISDQNQ